MSSKGPPRASEEHGARMTQRVSLHSERLSFPGTEADVENSSWARDRRV